MSDAAQSRLKKLYDEMAEVAKAQGVQPTDEDVGQWVADFVDCDPDDQFFITIGVASSLADSLARDEGYKSQADRILRRMREGKTGPVRNPRPRVT